MTSIISEIVNEKLLREEGTELSGIPFYRQIQAELSRVVELSSPNY